MLAPILMDALIDRTLGEQRRHVRPPSERGYSAWTVRVEQALETLTTGNWCQLGWIERANHRGVTHPGRYQVQCHVDMGEVQLERKPAVSTTMPGCPD